MGFFDDVGSFFEGVHNKFEHAVTIVFYYLKGGISTIFNAVEGNAQSFNFSC
jgi:hypothetical protein